MDRLYKKICKGDYLDVPKIYSDELTFVISKMIDVRTEFRPSCWEIMKMKIVQKKIEEIAELKETEGKGKLIKPI